MPAPRFARIAMIAAIVVIGSTAAAFAASIAYTKSATNFREGPGTGYDVISVLPKNTKLVVDGCTTNWCGVTDPSNEDGYVAKSSLKATLSGPDIPFSFGITVGPGGTPSITFGIGNTPPAPEPVADQVCFYKGPNYSGSKRCVNSGEYDEDITGSWNDNIESIRVPGGMEVEVCRNPDFVICKTYNNNVAVLPLQLRNRISSYDVN